MNQYDKTADILFNTSNDIIDDSCALINQNNMTYDNINIADIASILIYNAGRFCERYASDVIITYDELREKITKHMQTTDCIPADVILFGFRKSGVDSNVFIHNQIENHLSIDNYYRKVLAVQILDHIDDDNYKTVYVTLKNVTNAVTSECYNRHKKG